MFGYYYNSLIFFAPCITSFILLTKHNVYSSKAKWSDTILILVNYLFISILRYQYPCTAKVLINKKYKWKFCNIATWLKTLAMFANGSNLVIMNNLIEYVTETYFAISHFSPCTQNRALCYKSWTTNEINKFD